MHRRRLMAVFFCLLGPWLTSSAALADALFKYERQGVIGQECHADCPSGYLPIAGGFNGVNAAISRPYGSNRGWHVKGTEIINGSGCHAVCVNFSAPFVSQMYTSEKTAPGLAHDHDLTAWCNAGDIAISGGWSNFVSPHTATFASDGALQGFRVIVHDGFYGSQPTALAMCVPKAYSGYFNLSPNVSPTNGHCRATCAVQGYTPYFGGHEGQRVKHSEIEPYPTAGQSPDRWMFHPAPTACRAICMKAQ